MFYDDYLDIDILVESVCNNNIDALWQLFDFYKPVINSGVNRVHKKYPYIEKGDLTSESILILKDLCSKYNKEKSHFTYFFDTRLQPYLIAKIKSKYCGYLFLMVSLIKR